MGLQLMKIYASATITTNTAPADTRYFYVTTGNTAPAGVLTVNVAAFFDDAGATPTTLPTLNPTNNFYNVYINGVLQMSGISAYTTQNLVVTVPTGSPTLNTGTPVVLEVVNFTPSSNATIVT